MSEYTRQDARSTMLASSKRDMGFRERLAPISFWLFALLPVSLYAGDRVCGGYISPSLYPFDSPCFVQVELFDDDALRLIGATDKAQQNYLLVVAISKRIDTQQCTEDELELFAGVDTSAVSRQLVLYEHPIHVQEGFCKVRSTWSINLDESWEYSETRQTQVLVSQPLRGSDACNDLVLEDFVNLQSDIPDQAVAAILGQAEAILRGVAEQIGRDPTELCIRSLGIGEPEESSRQYVLEIGPTMHQAFIRFGPDFETEITLVRK